MTAENKHVWLYGGSAALAGIVVLILLSRGSSASVPNTAPFNQPQPANPDWGQLQTVPSLSSAAPVTNINLGQVPVYVPQPAVPATASGNASGSCSGCCGGCDDCPAGEATYPLLAANNVAPVLQRMYESAYANE